MTDLTFSLYTVAILTYGGATYKRRPFVSIDCTTTIPEGKRSSKRCSISVDEKWSFISYYMTARFPDE